MLKQILQFALRRVALSSGRLAGLYRRFCQPIGEEWAIYLKRHGDLHAIGENCSIQINVAITDPPHVRLGNNVRLTGCTLFGHDGAVSMLKQMTGMKLDRVGKIDIRDNVFVGHHAIIMPGVTIGPNAIVGAGSLVTRDVPPNSVVCGSPARVICTLDDYLKRCAERTEQLPWSDHPRLAPDFHGPASPDLTRQRIEYFFPNPVV